MTAQSLLLILSLFFGIVWDEVLALSDWLSSFRFRAGFSLMINSYISEERA
jgi:hypothetical protein